LIWLGYADSAGGLIEQVRHDPDAEMLGALLSAWHTACGSTLTTVRKAVEVAYRDNGDLLDAIREFPIMERGEINRGKFGWLLSRDANRIVNGLELRQRSADGRKAWRVVKAAPPPLPALPPSTSPVSENGMTFGRRM
jgi:hypothetical protein